MPALFLALQCFQCSTMQVKQQRRSSSKWVCAVCNERQSVRRVHAQGLLARDLRHFVQAFNMARSHGSDGHEWISRRSEVTRGGTEAEGGARGGAKRRTDWTEFLDPEEEEEGEEEDGDVVTELPPEMSERFFPKRPSRANLKPSFSKRRQSPNLQGSREVSKRRKASEVVKAPSKWSEYLEEGEKEEDDPRERCSKLDEANGLWSGDQCLFDGVNVQEEVHPHFK